MARQVCYCFNYTDQDIIDDVRLNGASRILEAIQNAKRSGRCQCREKHPQGN